MFNHKLAVALVMCLLAAAAAADDGKVVAPDVLKHVPVDCLGFAVVKNVAQCTDRIDAFLKTISVGGGEEEIRVLPMIQAMVRMGEGFDPKGGFAAVMLDPQQFELDLVSLIVGPDPKAAAPARQPPPLPLVLLIPGKGSARMFADREPTVDGKLVKFAGDDETPRYCLQVGNYVALGPNRKAVETVARGGASISAALPASDKAFIAANDVAVWVNFKVLSPILDAAIGRMKDGMDAPVAAIVNDWREKFKQMTDANIGLKFGAKGIELDMRASYSPTSAVGKVLTAWKPVATALLSKLPASAYAFAFSMTDPPKMPSDDVAKNIDRMLTEDPCKALDADDKARFKKALLTMDRQVRGVQLMVAPGAEGSATIRVGAVLECLSAAEVRKALADCAASLAALVKAHAAVDMAPPVTITHVSGKDTDRVVLALDEKRRAIAKSVLGVESIEILIKQTDAKTLVISAPGKGFLASLVASAGSAKGLNADPKVATALARMPVKPLAVALFDARGIQAIIKAVRTARGEKPLADDMRASAPFVFGVYARGADVGIAIDLPAETIREIISTVKAAMNAAANVE